MQLLHPISGESHPDDRSTAVRLLRSACWMFFANPLALVVAAVCLCLLARMVLSICQARAAGIEWRMTSVLSCGSFIIAVSVLACAAIIHMVVMGITGWRSGRE